MAGYLQEMSAVKSAIKAYQDGDDEELQRVFSGGYWKAMDNDVSHLLPHFYPPSILSLTLVAALVPPPHKDNPCTRQWSRGRRSR